ncbi:Alcohol dehydrogenase protein [Rutstroemia sp. NJR-2017a WRK4]|nr:Alcohol dehydrogenase protein [Rutstroemia sp. NJR-2017a WRK4]
MATEDPPSTMRALALAKLGKPEIYDVATVPTPKITREGEVLIKVEAASVNPVDVKMASGLPYLMGYDVSGTIHSVHPSVHTFKPGDKVYSRVPEPYRGTIAEYCLSLSHTTALAPPSLTPSEAASVPLVALTAYQSLLRGDAQLSGGLKDKTVFVPAGMSGTGSIAVQLAKNVFGAKRVIMTVSTGKMGRVKELLGEDIEAVDYTTENVVQRIGNGTVDFMFDTVGGSLTYGGLVKKKGAIVSVSMIPGGTATRERMERWMGDRRGEIRVSAVVVKLLDFADWVLRRWAQWKGRRYSYLMMEPSGEDLEKLAGWIEEGKVRPIVGSEVKLEDVEGVRRGCRQVYDAKGGVGKFVVVVG